MRPHGLGGSACGLIDGGGLHEASLTRLGLTHPLFCSHHCLPDRHGSDREAKLPPLLRQGLERPRLPLKLTPGRVRHHLVDLCQEVSDLELGGLRAGWGPSSCKAAVAAEWTAHEG